MKDDGQMEKQPDPFGGGSRVLMWSREVQVGQLQHEMTEALGPEVQIAVHLPLDEAGDVRPVDAAHQLKIYLSAGVDVEGARKVLAAHRPDPYYGMSDEERRTAQLVEKIHSGDELSGPELQRAVRLLYA